MKKVKAVFSFELTRDGKKGVWFVDAKKEGKLYRGAQKSKYGIWVGLQIIYLVGWVGWGDMYAWLPICGKKECLL